MIKEKHVHKYKRLRHKSGTAIFFCALPDCTHKISTPLALGKKCICWRCNNEFIMNEYSLRLAKPHCENCHKSKEVKREGLNPVILDLSLEKVEFTRDFSAPMSLSERLTKTIQQTQAEIEDEI